MVYITSMVRIWFISMARIWFLSMESFVCMRKVETGWLKFCSPWAGRAEEGLLSPGRD